MKVLNITIIFMFLYLASSDSFAETKEDCSKYNTDTFMGTIDKLRCEKGKAPRKKWSIGKIFKKN